MHTYSTDNDKRPTVYGVLGFAAYLLVLIIGWATSLLAAGLPAIAGGTISWGLAFTILSAGFIRRGWKTPVARSTGASRAPDFSGDWKGYIKTSYEGHIDEEALHESNDTEAEMQRVAAKLHIDQTWRKISVHLSTENSESDSTGATVLTKEGRWPSLTYQYGNEPDVDSESSMRAHDGTADLSLKRNGEQDVLEGFYYTGPGRENYGEMYFERQP
ncbi:hypothetical protein GJ631_02705 [Natronomonas sp. CBA1123]|jgi:hypothetical protein|uniref:Cap15 family cyclic dinucleotide receptor domain-containing protein n=1 Tax=Natronomonas sp. CBA1123 TaxID=2668070 RepID=UPI0012EAAD1A|nr:hypothetical protein [Natronomonas sp. CBA1123]MUV85518.1 hypothetical protein [Natronomonas sp. CBA1123]